MRRTTTYLKQSLVAVLVALAAALAVVWNQAGEIKPRRAPYETLKGSLIEEPIQRFAAQPRDLFLKTEPQEAPWVALPAGEDSALGCFAEQADGFSYLLLGSKFDTGAMAAKVICLN